MKPTAKFFARALISGIAALGLSACVISIDDDDVHSSYADYGDRPVIGETVVTDDFSRVSLGGADNVVVVPGDRFSWMVSADSDDVRNLRIRVEGDTLKIRRVGNSYRYDPASIVVTAPALSGFSLAGSGDATITEMTGDSATISVAGSGNVTVGTVNVSQLDVSIAGSGEATLAGAAGLMNANVSGSGDLKAVDLNVSRAAVSVAGSGDAVFASDGEVDASVVGSGDIVVRGSAICNVNSRGSGSIRCG